MKNGKKLFALIAVIGFSITACNSSPDVSSIDQMGSTTGGTSASGNVIFYPWPDEMPRFKGVTLKADGEIINLYSVMANITHRWNENIQTAVGARIAIPVAMFDMAGDVDIEIGLPVNVENAIVRPINSGITPTVSGRIITFTIPADKTNQYSVEWNNNAINPTNTILIFANPHETFTGTIIVEPGVHVRDYFVSSGQTLYLKPGAVVRGSISVNTGGKLVGRGIIDGSHRINWIKDCWRAVLPVVTSDASNVEINGISIFDPNAWCMEIRNSSNVLISNVKIISSRCNSDGISIQSSNNVTIDKCFIRSWDDGVVIKNYSNTLNSHTITVKDTRLWTDLAQALEIGVETNKGQPGGCSRGPHALGAACTAPVNPDPKIYDVTFEDITVFHALHKAPISIHNGDNAVITNIIFKDIVIENYQSGLGDGWNYLIDITNLTGRDMMGAPSWTHITDRGSISGVHIENIHVLSGRRPGYRVRSSLGAQNSDVAGFIEISYKNITYNGTEWNFTSNCPNSTVTKLQ